MYLLTALSRGAGGYVIPCVSALSSHLREPVCSFPSAFPSASSPCAPLLHPIQFHPTRCAFPLRLPNSAFRRALCCPFCAFSSCFPFRCIPFLCARCALSRSHASYSV